jgi:hypothetical protein
VENELTRQFHLQAPPSFGDPDVAGFGGKLRNDYAPSNCRIVYTIQASLTRQSLATERNQMILQKSLKIRLKPSSTALIQPSLSPISPSPSPSPSLAPLTTSASADSETPHQQTIDIYEQIPTPISKSLSISKSKSRTKIGQLTTTIIAPPRFDIPVRETDASVRQAIRLTLHYEREPNSNANANPNPNSNNHNQHDPAGLPKPPQIQSLRGTVVANTFFTKTPHTSIPRKKRDRLGTKLNYAEKVLTEFTHSITSLSWAASENNNNDNDNDNENDNDSLRPSQSDSQIEQNQNRNQSPTRFTSTLLVPVKLAHQFIIPTFHSCRISRTYTLVLRLKVQGAATVEIATPMLMAPAEDFAGVGTQLGGGSPPPYSFARSYTATSSASSTLFDGPGMDVIEGIEGEGRNL